ncbi:phosphatidylinositol 3, partial [Hortaea werneckii]
MSIKELEVLTALCKAAPLVQTSKDAAQLLGQLSPYVPEAHKQALQFSPLYQHLPPWEALSYDLTAAVLAIGLNHPSLRPTVLGCIDQTVDELAKSAEKVFWIKAEADGVPDADATQDSLHAVQLTVSLLGFLEAISAYAQVWTIEERLSLIKKVRYLLSEKFMVSLEGALSAIRNAHVASPAIKVWKRWVRLYATQTRPLGAMLLHKAFMELVEQSVSLLVARDESLAGVPLLDALLLRQAFAASYESPIIPEVVENIAGLVVDEMNLLETDTDYLQVSSAWQQRLALQVKASSLRSFLCCSLMDEEAADVEALLSWLEASTSDTLQMAQDELAQTVLKCMAILARTSPAIAANLTRSLPRLIVQGRMTQETAALAGECLARVLKNLSQDVVISTVYSLGNVLSSQPGTEKLDAHAPFFDGATSINADLTAPYGGHHPPGSTLSLAISDEGAGVERYGAIVQAIVAIASAYREEQMTALVISILVQKVSRVSPIVDAKIVTEMAALGLSGGPNELRALLRLYSKVASEATSKQDHTLVNAVLEARVRLASWIHKDSPLFEVYLVHLLALCVGSGDTAGERAVDVTLAAKVISQLFRPMAVLVSNDPGEEPRFNNQAELSALSRNAWFNIVVHGFTLTSQAGKDHAQELQILAQYTLPLVDEERIDQPESGIDLNTVLRRGANPQHTIEQKQLLIAALPSCETEIKGLGYQETV